MKKNINTSKEKLLLNELKEKRDDEIVLSVKRVIFAVLLPLPYTIKKAIKQCRKAKCAIDDVKDYSISLKEKHTSEATEK